MKQSALHTAVDAVDTDLSSLQAKLLPNPLLFLFPKLKSFDCLAEILSFKEERVQSSITRGTPQS